MNLTICVLIPTKNRQALLERAIESIFDQTILPDEIIVVNDGSIDSTKKFLDSIKSNHSNLKIINRGESGGVNTARNQGIKESSSEWVAFLDDDDEFVPDAIKIMKEKIVSMPEIYNVAYFNTKIINDQGSFIGGFQFDKINKNINFYDPTYEETMTKFNLWRDCKQVMKRELFKDATYKFPETVNGFESYTMNLIAHDKKGIRYFRDVLTLIHQESNLKDRLSITAPQKKPWQMFILHTKQIFQHWKFYFSHPFELWRKKLTMLKLIINTLF